MKKVELRKLLFGLSIAVCVISFLSIFPFTSFIVNGFFILSIVISIWKESKNIEELIDRKILTFIAILGTVFLLSQISFNNIVIPITNTILFLLSIKFLDKKEPRDFYQILGLSLILFAAAGTLTFSIKFIVLFIIESITVLFGTVLLTYYSESQNLTLEVTEIKSLLNFSILFFTASIPLTILFFIILPRTQTPIFDVGLKNFTGATGFSNTIKLGEVTNIQQVDAVVMRVATEKLPFPPYFRSITFEEFKNGRWIHINTHLTNRLTLKGKVIPQTVILEPYGFKNLPLINVPLTLKGVKAKYSKGLFFEKTTPVKKRIKYSGNSVLTSEVPDTLTEKERKIYTDTKDIDPEIKTFLTKVFKNTPSEKLPAQLLIFFRKNYRYSLSQLPSSLKDFLINKKAGNCEFFATAAALTFRLKGIPSRLVGGFYKGEYNPFGNYYIVKDKDAHVWVEYYLNGKWHHFEPTFGIPEKKEISKNTVSTLQKAHKKRELSFKEKLSLILDTINYYWINSVINYDFQTQIETAQKLRSSIKSFKLPSFEKFSLKKENVLYTLISIIPFLIAWIIMKKQKDILELFYETLEKKGYTREKNEPLEIFIKKIKEKELREKAEKFVKLYEEKFYKDKKVCCQTLEELRKILKEIKKEEKSGN